MRKRNYLYLLIGLIAIFGTASSCGGQEVPDSQESELRIQQNGYDGLVAGQPARDMDHSPTRDTINAWSDTWEVPGQVAFTYLLNFDGDAIGYYVLVGPPVSYCASLTPTYDIIAIDGLAERVDTIVPAPSLDGVFYSGSQCIQYFGIDASTGALVEFTAGGSLNFFNSTQPLPNFIDVPAFGPTELGDIQPDENGEYIVDVPDPD